VLVAIRVRPAMAAVVGLFMGFVADSLALHAFGSAALAMAVVAFSASWLKAVFFADDVALNAFFFFLGKWGFDAVYLLAQHHSATGELLVEIMVWSPLKGAVTAVFGLLTLAILRPILRTSAT
jgi:rod shape-determining protein MreD